MAGTSERHSLQLSNQTHGTPAKLGRTLTINPNPNTNPKLCRWRQLLKVAIFLHVWPWTQTVNRKFHLKLAMTLCFRPPSRVLWLKIECCTEGWCHKSPQCGATPFSLTRAKTPVSVPAQSFDMLRLKIWSNTEAGNIKFYTVQGCTMLITVSVEKMTTATTPK